MPAPAIDPSAPDCCDHCWSVRYELAELKSLLSKLEVKIGEAYALADHADSFTRPIGGTQ